MHTSLSVLRRSPASPAIIALLAAAGAAPAQPAPLGGGRALDRNLNVAETTVNPYGPRIQDQINYNNAIMTGNATGGRSFQGRIGFRATTDFASALPSNDLYSFQRDAALSAVGNLGIRSSDALRYQFALATGNSVPDAALGLATAQRWGSAETPESAGSITPGAIRATSEFLTGQSIRPALVGYQIDSQGFELTARASPMMGIEWARSTNPVVRLDRTADELAAEDLGVSANPLVPPVQITPGGNSTGPETPPPGTAGLLDRNAAAGPDLRVARPQLQVSTPAFAQVSDAFRQGFTANATLPGDQDKNKDLDKDGKDRDGNDKSGQAAKAPVDNSLDAQLARLRGHMRPDAPTGQKQGWNPLKPIEQDKGQDGNKLGDLLNQDKNKDHAPDASQNPSGQSDLSKLLNPGDLKNQDKPVVEDNATKLSANERLTPEVARALRNTGSVRIERLAKVEAMSQPARPDQAKYLAAMSAGEEAFAKGRFFEAEDKFNRAIAAVPGDPMARIGRAHAQLGAGLFLSAAANLRGIFADHPELIGANYADNLAISAERATNLATQLREEMTRGSSALGRDSAFLLAYLGHLRGDDKLAQEGLIEMGKRFDPTSDADTTLYQACKAAWGK